MGQPRCRDLQALDLGHNMVNDINFLTEFKHLKILILADNSVVDISPLAKLQELEYVEMFRNHITDLTPLASLPNLRDVNMCRNFGIKDATMLLACPKLERVWLAYCGIDEAQQAQLPRPSQAQEQRQVQPQVPALAHALPRSPPGRQQRLKKAVLKQWPPIWRAGSKCARRAPAR